MGKGGRDESMNHRSAPGMEAASHMRYPIVVPHDQPPLMKNGEVEAKFGKDYVCSIRCLEYDTVWLIKWQSNGTSHASGPKKILSRSG